jgi:hypothetical protein
LRVVSKLFQEHPASVGESYFEHMLTAFAFGARMLFGGCASIIHSLLPCAFVRTGSAQIRYLHQRMIVARGRQPACTKAEPTAQREHNS